MDYHYFGTGDKGGSPADDAVHWLEHSLKGTGPLRVVSATAERMFNDLNAEQISKLPTYKGVPIIFLTTESDAGLKQEAKTAGATGWITKPFQQEQLVAVIKKVLGS